MKENQIRVLRRRDEAFAGSRVLSCNVVLIVEERCVLLEGTWDGGAHRSGVDRGNFSWAIGKGVWWATQLKLPLVVESGGGVEITYRDMEVAAKKARQQA